MTVPFTVSSDIELGRRIAPFLSAAGADVRIQQGEVPETLDDTPDNPVSGGTAYKVNADNFLLNVPNGVRYLVRGGDTIIYERKSGVSDREVALFLLGSAWGALCYQRNLLPLHASAIIIGDEVHAFTGMSGAGKSTLSAALADRGFDFFTDDILIVDAEQQGDEVICYSGQKDLKLWKDALSLTKAVKGDPVRDVEGFDKFFATPNREVSASSGNLTSLSILATSEERWVGADCKLVPITGGASVVQLAGSVYRPQYAQSIWGRKKLYSALGQVIRGVAVQRFHRPFVSSEFDRGMDFFEQWLNQQAPASRSETASSTASQSG